MYVPILRSRSLLVVDIPCMPSNVLKLEATLNHDSIEQDLRSRLLGNLIRQKIACKRPVNWIADEGRKVEGVRGV